MTGSPKRLAGGGPAGRFGGGMENISGVGIRVDGGPRRIRLGLGNVDGRDVLYCLDAATGREKWQQSYRVLGWKEP
jgi:outer membrane protein assembly factor BamB